MGKHAYLIIANSNFKVLRKCLELLDDTRNDIFLLFDKKSRVTEAYRQSLYSAIHSSNIRICEDLTINWGGVSQVLAVMHIMQQAINFNSTYDYIHFFQGADMPIKKQNEIHSFFDSKKGTQFVNIDKYQTKMAEGKCHYRHYFCHNRFFRKSKLVKALNFGLVQVQKLLQVKKNQDIALFQGSALFSITSECAQYVLSRAGEIKKRFRFSLAADEVFLQTILMDSPFKNDIANIDMEHTSNARLIDRSRPSARNSPHVWTADEFEFIVKQPVDICFARKFDENCDFEVVCMLCNYLKIV